jgi:hypothetical protein
MIRRLSAAAIVAATLSLYAASNPADAVRVFQNGNELFTLCNNNSLVCLGYAAAISDAMSSTQEDGGSIAGWRACEPVAVTQGQVRDVTVAFLRAHPEIRHLAAASLVAKALAEAWPCR